jgi:hypothetical protein
MVIAVCRNYDEPSFLRQSPGGTGRWGPHRYVETPADDGDVLVCLNPPRKPIRTRLPRSHRWLIIQEPPVARFRSYRNHAPWFGHVVDSTAGAAGAIPTQSCLPWHLGLNYDELCRMDVPEKTADLSTVTSRHTLLAGHRRRRYFLSALQAAGLSFDHFGKGIRPLARKEEGLLPYRYSLCLENTVVPHYWTEKLADSFLAYCMPIYVGAPNIGRYFPAGSFMSVDPGRPRAAARQIRLAMEEGHWERNLDRIRTARQLILEEYQFFPWVGRLLEGKGIVGPPARLLEKPETIPAYPYGQPSLGSRWVHKSNQWKYDLCRHLHL